MSLFAQLLRLHSGSTPLEDFFTEIFAYSIRTYPELLYTWLSSLGITFKTKQLSYSVSTQKSYKALPKHHTDSRPDIVIEGSDNDRRFVLFVESKVGSHEGDRQLSRYADILHNQSDFDKRYLVYITRDFDPKDEANIFESEYFQDSETHPVKFVQSRWYGFYYELVKQPKTDLISQTIQFMEEHGMSSNNQFSATNIMVLKNLTASLALMKESMSDEVKNYFKRISGEMLGSKKLQMNRDSILQRLQEEDRYFFGSWNESYDFWFGMGFEFHSSDIAKYPTLKITLAVRGDSKKLKELESAMRAACNDLDW